MKTSILQFTIALMIAGIITSCTDLDVIHPPGKIKVEFDSTSITMSENAGDRVVSISFAGPARHDGWIALSVSTEDRSRITFEPNMGPGQILLSVAKGITSTSFRLKPIDNSVADSDMIFDMTIVDTCPQFVIGAQKLTSVRLTDDDSSGNSRKSAANILKPDSKLREDGQSGAVLRINFSEPLTATGTIELRLESTQAGYGIHFTTMPAAINGKITLDATTGATQAALTIFPIDNPHATGESEITAIIEKTTGSIIKGNDISQSLVMVDDEMLNKPRSYELSSGQWRLKKEYQYDLSGRLQFVHSEKSTPTTSTHTETYFYQADGRILKINLYPQIDKVFTWTGSRITRSENIDHGIIKEYTDYDYDNGGNVSGAANYFRQPDGTFKLGFLNTYLYFNDGNLYKKQTYIAGDNPGQYILLSSGTFADYIDAENPFPVVDILPNIRTQTKLPGRYTLEEHGVTLEYLMTYEYTQDGLVKNRIARSGVNTEIAQYKYY